MIINKVSKTNFSMFTYPYMGETCLSMTPQKSLHLIYRQNICFLFICLTAIIWHTKSSNWISLPQLDEVFMLLTNESLIKQDLNFIFFSSSRSSYAFATQCTCLVSWGGNRPYYTYMQGVVKNVLQTS
jgi:hypothetical protein